MLDRARAAVVGLAGLVAATTSACGGGGSPSSPDTTQGQVSEGGAADAAAGDASSGGSSDASSGGSNDAGPTDAAPANFAVCPPGLDASFTDLLTRVMSTSSCGTNDQASCHSTKGSTAAGNDLDFTLDAGAVYNELVGVPSVNPSGTGHPLRVAPGDAGGSMLYVKLTLKTLSDPTYGAGMPLTAPGSVCPEALDAFKSWIDQGAKP